MYNGKQIQAFIDKVNKEASEAAQKVYDKYRPELIRMIQAQLHADDCVNGWYGHGVN